MKNIIILCILSVLFISCSSKDMSKIKEVNNYVSFKERAINLKYSSSKKLNYYDDSGHSLFFMVYQLTDISNFKLYLKENGIEKLFTNKKFDNSVLYYSEYIIMPGAKDIIKIDRSKGTKWVVLVAGYFDYIKEEDIYTFYQLEVNKTPFSEIEYGILDLNVTFNENNFNSNIIEMEIENYE